MNMSSFEKRFVNASGHSRTVARLFERRLRQIPEVAPGMHYLDVGCGNGAAALHLARAFGLNVTGVDADPAQVRLAEASAGLENAQVHFQEANAERLPFADCSFDIVGTNKVTHHVPAWREAVAEMARVVARGGYLAFGDFVLPQWVADFGIAIPTVPGLEAVAESAGLAPIYWSRGLVTLEVVWWKPGPPVSR